MGTTLIDDIGLGALALLRTAAWLYGGLVVAAALTAPTDASPALAAALVLPLAPLVLTAVAYSLLAARERALPVGSFAAVAAVAGVTLMAAHAALPAGGATDLLVAVAAVGICGAAISCAASREAPR